MKQQRTFCKQVSIGAHTSGTIDLQDTGGALVKCNDIFVVPSTATVYQVIPSGVYGVQDWAASAAGATDAGAPGSLDLGSNNARGTRLELDYRDACNRILIINYHTAATIFYITYGVSLPQNAMRGNEWRNLRGS